VVTCSIAEADIWDEVHLSSDHNSDLNLVFRLYLPWLLLFISDLQVLHSSPELKIVDLMLIALIAHEYLQCGLSPLH
jgi:hypothetical protein